MNILIYGINYSPEPTGIGKYTGELTPWLARQGHDVRVVTAPPYYPDWRIPAPWRRWWYQRQFSDGVRVTRCPLFVPARPGTLSRLLHLASFAFTSFFAVFAQWRWRPDVVVLVVPTLFCAFNALLFARLTGAKCLVHVQDFEVDALFGLSGSTSWAKRFAQHIERWMLRRFDCVSTISSGMLRRAVEKGVDPEKVLLFPNWSEVERFQGVERDEHLLTELGVPAGRKVILYSGNLGDKQGLESIVEAARLLAGDTRLYFLVVGEGACKARMLAQARALGLDNIGFASLQPYEKLPALLASAACHLVVQRRGVADAVLPSKLTNILAVGGNAVITADPETTLGKLCGGSSDDGPDGPFPTYGLKEGCGLHSADIGPSDLLPPYVLNAGFPGIAVCVEPESPEALVAGIRQALDMPTPNPVAQDYARRFLDKEEVLGRFERELVGLVEGE